MAPLPQPFTDDAERARYRPRVAPAMRPPGMTNYPVQEFQIGRSKVRHGLAIAALCLLIGAATLALGDESLADRQWIGALLMALGLAIGVHAWLTGRRPGAHLRVDAAGVYFRDWGATLPWGEIADVYQSGSRLQPFVTLRLRHPRRFLAGLAEEEARRLDRNRLWKPPELRIPYSAVEATRDEVLAAIEAGLGRQKPPVA